MNRFYPVVLSDGDIDQLLDLVSGTMLGNQLIRATQPMTGEEIERSVIKTSPTSAVTEQVQALWGEIEYIFQDGIANRELQKVADEITELGRFVEACMQSNEKTYNLSSMTDRR